MQGKRTSVSPLPFLEEDNLSVPIVETPLLSTLSLTGGSQVNQPCTLTELILLENIPVAVEHEGRSSLSEKVGIPGPNPHGTGEEDYTEGWGGGDTVRSLGDHVLLIRRPLPSISSSGSCSIWVLSLEQENWRPCLGTTHLISPLCW